MNQGQTVFAQPIQHLSHNEFHRCADLYQGDHRIRSFACREQFLAKAFAQLTFKESFRTSKILLALYQRSSITLAFIRQ